MTSKIKSNQFVKPKGNPESLKNPSSVCTKGVKCVKGVTLIRHDNVNLISKDFFVASCVYRLYFISCNYQNMAPVISKPAYAIGTDQPCSAVGDGSKPFEKKLNHFQIQSWQISYQMLYITSNQIQ